MGQPIARRIASGYAVLLASLFLVVTMTLMAGVVAQRAGEDMIEVSIPRIRLIRDLGKAIERMRVWAIRYVDEPGTRSLARVALKRNTSEVAAMLTVLAQLERTPAEQAVFTDMRSQFSAYQAVVAQIERVSTAGHPDEARRALVGAMEAAERLRQGAERYSDLYLDRIDESRADADRALQRAAFLAIALALGSALIAAINWRHETREVVAPLLELRSAMDILSRGGPAPATHPAAARTLELKALQDGYNRMAAQIQADARALEAARDQLETRVAEQTAELREGAAHLAEMVQELQALDKMKSDFLAVMSHELLTPINFIIGFGSALEDELLGPLNATQADAVHKLLGGADRLTRMVNNTLEYTQAVSGALQLTPTTLDYPVLLEAVLADARAGFASKHQTLTVTTSTALPQVFADAKRTAQVLVELLRNASEFTPAGGTIDIQVTATVDAVTTAVTDQGPGLGAAALDRLFEPFYQADSTSTREHGGMGLGLAVAHHLVRAMGGTLVAESPPDTGARFWFTLPAAVSHASVDVEPRGHVENR